MLMSVIIRLTEVRVAGTRFGRKQTLNPKSLRNSMCVTKEMTNRAPGTIIEIMRCCRQTDGRERVQVWVV